MGSAVLFTAKAITEAELRKAIDLEIREYEKLPPTFPQADA